MKRQPRTEEAWYAAHGCTHAHCPDGCPKPQPVLASDGRMLCGRCLFKFGEEVEVVPCVPGVCGETPGGKESE